jgi:hypothetical protein
MTSHAPLTLADIRIDVADEYSIEGTELARFLLSGSAGDLASALRGLNSLLTSDLSPTDDEIEFVRRSLAAIADQIDHGRENPNEQRAAAARCKVVVLREGGAA